MLELCAYYIKKMESREEMPDTKYLADENQLSLLSHLNEQPNPLEDSISMIEKTSLKIYPIIKELLKRTIQESTPKEATTAIGTINKTDGGGEFNLKTTVSPVVTALELVQEEIKTEKLGGLEDPDMRSILGFLNQTEWIYSLNIGNIMQIAPISLQDIH